MSFLCRFYFSLVWLLYFRYNSYNFYLFLKKVEVITGYFILYIISAITITLEQLLHDNTILCFILKLFTINSSKMILGSQKEHMVFNWRQKWVTDETILHNPQFFRENHDSQPLKAGQKFIKINSSVQIWSNLHYLHLPIMMLALSEQQ